MIKDEEKEDAVGLDGTGVGGGDESTTCELDPGIKMDMDCVAAGPEANDRDGADSEVGMSTVGNVGLTGMVTGPSVGKGTTVRTSGTVSSVVVLLPFSITTCRTDCTTVWVLWAAYMDGGCRETPVGNAALLLTSGLRPPGCAASTLPRSVSSPLSGLASLLSLIVLE